MKWGGTGPRAENSKTKTEEVRGLKRANVVRLVCCALNYFGYVDYKQSEVYLELKFCGYILMCASLCLVLSSRGGEL